MTTSSGKQFIRDVIDRIDTVGWTQGAVYREDGCQCLVGAAASLRGVDYVAHRDAIDGRSDREVYRSLLDDLYTKENEAAAEVAEAIGLENSDWWAVTGFNDSHHSWSDLRAELLRRIEDDD